MTTLQTKIRDPLRTQIFVRKAGKQKKLGADEVLLLAHLMQVRPFFATDSALADALGVHRSRITAWKSGSRADPENAGLLAGLSAVISEMKKFLGATAIHDWLLSPQHELQQQTPVEALRKQRLPDVLQAANALEHVAYA